MNELEQLIARLNELRPDLVVVPRILSAEMDFKLYEAYLNTTTVEDLALKQYMATHNDGAPAVVSTAPQCAWSAAIEQFQREGGVNAPVNNFGDTHA